MSRGRRERELLRITKENMNMLKRISNKKPAISREKLENDWQQNLTFMSNISAFPEDWYLREKYSKSNPSLNTSTNHSTTASRDEKSKETQKPKHDSSDDNGDSKEEEAES